MKINQMLINWFKKSNKFNFEFIFNKSSKDDFKSDYISFKLMEVQLEILIFN